VILLCPDPGGVRLLLFEVAGHGIDEHLEEGLSVEPAGLPEGEDALLRRPLPKDRGDRGLRSIHQDFHLGGDLVIHVYDTESKNKFIPLALGNYYTLYAHCRHLVTKRSEIGCCWQ